MAFSEPHGWLTCTKSVDLYRVKVLWMLKWVDARYSLTIYNNGLKSAPAKSVQLFEQLRFRLCPLPCSAFFGGIRRTRVDRD